MDREVREPLELLSEIEGHLGMDAVPFSWPVGMGKAFGGVFDIRRDRMRMFRPGQERRSDNDDIIDGLANPEIARRLGSAFEQAPGEIGLIQEATPAFDPPPFLSGKKTPVFSVLAINNSVEDRKTTTKNSSTQYPSRMPASCVKK